jgi:hypothetical protein
MGNEQSASSNIGVSSSLSFLSRTRKWFFFRIIIIHVTGSSNYKSPIVVVGSRGNDGNPEDDENLKKLKVGVILLINLRYFIGNSPFSTYT